MSIENSEKPAAEVNNSEDSASNAFANEVYNMPTDMASCGSSGGGGSSNGGGGRGSRHYIEQFPLHIDRPSSYIQAQGEVRTGIKLN